MEFGKISDSIQVDLNPMDVYCEKDGGVRIIMLS